MTKRISMTVSQQLGQGVKRHDEAITPSATNKTHPPSLIGLNPRGPHWSAIHIGVSPRPVARPESETLGQCASARAVDKKWRGWGCWRETGRRGGVVT